MNRSPKRAAAAIVAALAVGAGAGAGGYAVVSGPGTAPAAPTPTAGSTATPVAATASSTLSVNQIWRQDGPGVVDITVTTGGGGAQQSATPFPFPGGPGGGGSGTAEGSGFVYDTSGHVITNDHVISGATSIKVKLHSGKTYTGKVVGADPSTDIAVVKIDAPSSELHPLALGDSDAVQVGDGVVAIGSPFGLVGTVTSGIVSALDRRIQAPNHYSITGAIQTDAPINHGNSGGPLLDLQGKVIGINAQIQSDSGGNDGVGFAIASNTVKRIATQLIANGSVKHAFLGVSLGPTGTIEQVEAGTPADKAGLQTGDVITAVDGKNVSSTPAIQSAIDGHEPGDEIQLTYTRNGSSKTVTVTLGTRPSSS